MALRVHTGKMQAKPSVQLLLTLTLLPLAAGVPSYVRRVVLPRLKLNSELNLDLELRIPIELVDSSDLNMNLVVRLPMAIPLNNETFQFLDQLGQDLYDLIEGGPANETNASVPLTASTVSTSNASSNSASNSARPIGLGMPISLTKPISFPRPAGPGSHSNKPRPEEHRTGRAHRLVRRSLEQNSIQHRLQLFELITTSLEE